ncbi:MAG: hypothetical protein K2X82_25585 [Gemmataceae bacterium]|nr:hypothetical protein [Gemmataceae bacterium]
MPPDLAPYVIVAWVVGVLAAFPSLPPRRAVLVTVLSGVLFLPEAVRGSIELGPVKLHKHHAIPYAALLAALLYDSGRLFAVAPRWFDLPTVVWCLVPLPSVLTNDPPPDGSPPLRDALSQAWGQVVTYGFPYLLGRAYFADRAALRDLAVGLVVAGAVYAPLCLWEARMSPNLHATVYGYGQHDFVQTIRFDGYRPMVFMQHGLAVGLFMAVAALAAVWLRRPAGLPGYLPWVLVPTAVLVKSTGAVALGVAGGAVLWLSRSTGSRWWLLALAAVPPAYVGARVTGVWSGDGLVEVVTESVGVDRAQSLAFRLKNEDLLVDKALRRPYFGWGGWGRNKVFDDGGRDQAITDGLWIIVFGDRGVVGLAALGAVLLAPAVRFAVRSDPRQWHTPALAPAAVCAVVVLLWTVDCLPNAMLNPVYLLMAAGLTGFDPAAADRPAAVRPPAD